MVGSVQGLEQSPRKGGREGAHFKFFKCQGPTAFLIAL